MDDATHTANLPALSVALQNLPAPVNASALPTTARHWAALNSPDKVDSYTRLIPAPACERVVAEVEQSLAVIAPERVAVGLVGVLVGSIPARRDAVEPSIYARSLAKIFAKFPQEIGELAVEHLIERLRFQPAPADVAEVLRSLVAKRRLVATRAQQHLAEHARRAEEAEAERSRIRYRDLPPEARARFDETVAVIRRGEETADPKKRASGTVRSLGAVLAGKRDEEVAA